MLILCPGVFYGIPTTTPGLENLGLRQQLWPQKSGLRFRLRAQNQTPPPTLGLTV